MTERSLQDIAEDGAARFDASDILVVHRCGAIAAGEVIVFVAVASAHRRAAFLAADYLMDRLKSDAVFWKKEQGVDGARWIEPTDADRADLARWSE
jgi:molybdopterin synthase catalytic subunit